MIIVLWLVYYTFLLVGWLLLLLRSKSLIWSLMGLELMNLGVLQWLATYQSVWLLLFVLSMQVMESVLLVGLVMIFMPAYSV